MQSLFLFSKLLSKINPSLRKHYSHLTESNEWKLEAHFQDAKTWHMRNLLQDPARAKNLVQKLRFV